MDADTFFLLVIFAALSGAIGTWIAKLKGRSPGEGFALGALLGPIGWLIETLLDSGDRARPAARLIPKPSPRRERKCPFCAEMILADAIVCRYCGKDVPPPEPVIRDKTHLFRDSLTR